MIKIGYFTLRKIKKAYENATPGDNKYIIEKTKKRVKIRYRSTGEKEFAIHLADLDEEGTMFWFYYTYILRDDGSYEFTRSGKYPYSFVR